MSKLKMTADMNALMIPHTFVLHGFMSLGSGAVIAVYDQVTKSFYTFLTNYEGEYFHKESHDNSDEAMKEMMEVYKTQTM